MNECRLYPAEYRMMDIFWDNEPMTTTALSKECAVRFGWSKNTAYTQIKRMVDRGFIEKNGTMLTAIISRDMVEQYDSGKIIRERFCGSLPKFIAAFLDGSEESLRELEQLKEFIDGYIGE